MTRTSPGKREAKLRTGVIILIVLILGLGLPAFHYGPRAYSHWQQRRLVAEARVLLSQKDYRKASLSLRRVLELNPSQLDASRLFAELAEAVGKSESVSLRERVCQLAPDSFDDAYAWSEAALRFGDVPRAAQALAIMQKTGPNRSGYHATLARLSRQAGRKKEAQAEFSQALQLEPNNEKLQYETALSDLEAGDASKRPEAIKLLERLRTLPAFHVPATRTLSAAYASGGDMVAGLPLAKELATAEGASMQDRLLYLTLLKASDNPHFIPWLTDLQTAVQKSPQETTLFLAWANTHDLVSLSREWLGTLPPAFVSTPPVAIAAADTYLILRDWKRLKTTVSTPGWGDTEFLRFAYLARVLQEEGDQAAAEVQWKAGIALVAKRSEKLYELAKIARQWGWEERWEGLLWYIADNTKQPQSALQALAARYGQERDTRNLQRTMASLLASDPKDLMVKNNWVMLSLLLRVDLERAVQTAQELYQANPKDAHTAATYAFALYSSNRTDDALEVMRKLPPEELRQPGIAAYYGVLLAALRDPEAPKYLELARTAQLLPEEEQLLKKAQLALQ